MTAFLDFKFTEAEASTDGFDTAPSFTVVRWSNPTNALDLNVEGAATVTTDFTTGVLKLSAPTVLSEYPANAAVRGISFDLWTSATTAFWNRSNIQTAFGQSLNFFSPSTQFSQYTNPAIPPVLPITMGGEDYLWNYSAMTLGQMLSGFAVELEGVAAGSNRTFAVWNVDGRVWLDVPSMQDIVERAYRKLAILSKDTTIEADDLAHGTMLLNDMLFGWEIFGVDIGHVERQAGEAFPIARKFVEATAMQLAERLSPDYQVPAMSSQRFFAALQREYNNVAQSDWRDLDGDGTVQDDEADAADRSEFY